MGSLFVLVQKIFFHAMLYMPSLTPCCSIDEEVDAIAEYFEKKPEDVIFNDSVHGRVQFHFDPEVKRFPAAARVRCPGVAGVIFEK